MTIQSLPVENLPFLYISGMNLSVASNTMMAIAPGQCRDFNDNIDIPFQSSYFINTSINGAGGLDYGTLSASASYAVWAIADSNNKHQPAAILSLWSNAYPLIPLGYDSYRLLGFVSTNSSTQLTPASVLNTSSSKGFFLSPAVGVLSGGNATSFTAIDLSGAIPTTVAPFVIALATVTFIPAAANDVLVFRPTLSASTTNLVTITGVSAGVAQTNSVILHCGVGSSKPEVDYKVSVSGDSATVLINGYYSTLS